MLVAGAVDTYRSLSTSASVQASMTSTYLRCTRSRLLHRTSVTLLWTLSTHSMWLNNTYFFDEYYYVNITFNQSTLLCCNNKYKLHIHNVVWSMLPCFCRDLGCDYGILQSEPVLPKTDVASIVRQSMEDGGDHLLTGAATLSPQDTSRALFALSQHVDK